LKKMFAFGEKIFLQMLAISQKIDSFRRLLRVEQNGSECEIENIRNHIYKYIQIEKIFIHFS